MEDSGRRVVLSTKVYPRERALVKAAAEVDELSPSAWIRRAVVSAARTRLSEVSKPVPADA